MKTIKVAFPTSDSVDSRVEIMHAEPLGGNRYKLDNSPFYVFGISYCDVFIAEETANEILFKNIERRGGHSTYRIKLPNGKTHEYFLNHWEELKGMGCTYEGSSANTRRLYSIDMPPTVNVYKAYKVLEDKETQGIWDFEEGHYFGSS